MIYILYSDDYEVCLGGNFTQEKEVVIETTEQVLSTCESIGVPITLFCDLACLWRYRELGYNEFPDLVDSQLKSAVEKRNDVQAHIHPHWLETQVTYSVEGFSKYDFDLSKFLMGNWFPGGGVPLRQFCYTLLERAKLYLENLLCSVNPYYRCIAFRAGGYGIQPNTKEIFQALIDTGYLIDSSIVPGMVLATNVNQIDFAGVPKQGNYFLSPESGLNQASEKGIFEIPILALRNSKDRWILAKNFPLRVFTYLRNIYGSKNLGYGIQSTAKGSGLSVILREFDSLFHPFWRLELRADTTVKMMLDAVTSYINAYYDQRSDIYFAFSLHSKSINLNMLNNLKEFHYRLQRIYGDQLKAITFQEAGHLMSLIRPSNLRQ
jgi:hypothetical protein